MNKQELQKHRERLAEMQAAAAPLMKLLCEKYDPYTTVRVTFTSFEVVQSVMAKHEILDFIND